MIVTQYLLMAGKAGGQLPQGSVSDKRTMSSQWFMWITP